jgi:hypothetical protein
MQTVASGFSNHGCAHMRRLDELTRLSNDVCARLPRSAWSWPLVAAAAGALVTLVASPPEVSTASDATVGIASHAAVTPAAVETSPACEQQTWPYLTEACLQRNRPAHAQGAQTPPAHVRVLDYDPALAQAAIGATPWAPRQTVRSPQSRQKQPGHRQATQDRDRTRTVTVRSSRNGRSMERVYNVPSDAYSAYGYIPRR